MTFIVEVMLGGSVIDVENVENVEKTGAGGLMIAGQGPYGETAKGVFRSDEIKTEIDGGFGDSSIWTFVWDEVDQTYYLAPRIGAVRSWAGNTEAGIVQRIHLSLLALIALAMLMVLVFGNYVGFYLP